MAQDGGVDDRRDETLVTEIELTGLAQTPERRALRFVLRFGPATLALVLLAVLLRSGVLGRLSLEHLRDSRAALSAFVRAHPVQSVLAYAGAYTVCVALSLPVALPLTLAGGFLFGPWIGGLAASVGCTAGASIVFLVSRLAVGDSVEARSGPRVRALAEEIKKDAFFYLLTLRLIPVTPFWLANVAAALIAIPLATFASATFLGILPPAFIYAGVGADLGALFDAGKAPDLHTLITPGVALPLLGLALLSTLPILIQRRRGRRSRDS
jgi:uncharacterized membrane protein YdjX (TVP38/TMEM64 family)